MLKSAQGLFLVSDTVTREEWKEFVEILEVDKFYPGIQGIGYTTVVQPEKLSEFEANIRGEGFPDINLNVPETCIPVSFTWSLLTPGTGGLLVLICIQIPSGERP